MAKIFYQEDCNLTLLEGKTIAIIGYGSQREKIRFGYENRRMDGICL